MSKLFCLGEFLASLLWGTFKHKVWHSQNIMLTIQSLLKSDKHLISPYNITSESNVTVKRIKEMISNWKSSSLFYKFSSSVPLEMSRKQCWGICTLILECREWMDRTLYCDRASLSFHRYKWVQQTARGKRFWDKICKWLAIWLETCNPLLGVSIWTNYQ